MLWVLIRSASVMFSSRNKSDTHSFLSRHALYTEVVERGKLSQQLVLSASELGS